MRLCATTFKPLPVPPKSGGPAGYAVRNGECIGYEQADREQRIDLAACKTGDRFTMYVNGNETHLTTWTGGRLMRITYRQTYRGGFGYSTMYQYWACDHRGRCWYGVNGGFFGGGGCVITMRLLKPE